MRATLLFPPVTDPRGPHLALGCLAAALRGAGVETTVRDLDLEGLLALLEPARLAVSGKAVRDRAAGHPRLAALSESLPERVPGALEALRHPETFYDPHRLASARETVFDAMELAAAAAPAGVTYRFGQTIDYEVEGVDPCRLGDLVRATGDRGGNLWADWWEEDLYPSLERERPDFVGVSILNRQQILPGLHLARSLRERGHFVVLGGTVFTKFVPELLELPAFFERFADALVAYEGETALVDLAGALEGGRDLSRVPNLLYLENGRVRFTLPHVEDVDRLATPDFEGLPLERYLAPAPVLPILVGKGCYFNRCKFCDIPYINRVSRKAYRVRRAERVGADVLELRRRFGARHFVVTDETLSPRLLSELAEVLEPHAGERFRFVGYARLEPGFTREACDRIARLGMRKLYFGLESGDQGTLDRMEKGIRVEHVRPVLENCLAAGIVFHVFSIVGFPEEGASSARNTLRFFEENADLFDHPGVSFDAHPFGLELRSRYFDEAERHGIEIAPGALEREFVIGLRDGWRNLRGLSPLEAAGLLAEFNLDLRRLYRRYQNGPSPLWPGFEEYAVLYADRYERGEFPCRTSLPGEEEVRAFRLSWNPAAHVAPEDGGVRIRSRWGDVRLDAPTYQALGSGRETTTSSFLAECTAGTPPEKLAEARAAVRDTIDGLIGLRLLQVELAP